MPAHIKPQGYPSPLSGSVKMDSVLRMLVERHSFSMKEDNESDAVRSCTFSTDGGKLSAVNMALKSRQWANSSISLAPDISKAYQPSAPFCMKPCSFYQTTEGILYMWKHLLELVSNNRWSPNGNPGPGAATNCHHPHQLGCCPPPSRGLERPHAASPTLRWPCKDFGGPKNATADCHCP